jgi:pilus assembly protein Flp/PilA
MMEMFKNLLVEEEGQGMAEYALILAGVAIAVIVALIALGDEITTSFRKTSWVTFKRWRRKINPFFKIRTVSSQAQEGSCPRTCAGQLFL